MADPDFGKHRILVETILIQIFNIIDDKIVKRPSRFLKGKKYNTSKGNSYSDTCPINFTLQTVFLFPQRERGGRFGK